MADVVSVRDMDDESLMKHFENRHADDLSMEFRPEPGRIERRLSSPSAWREYHDAMHRLYPRKYEHTHVDVVRG